TSSTSSGPAPRTASPCCSSSPASVADARRPGAARVRGPVRAGPARPEGLRVPGLRQHDPAGARPRGRLGRGRARHAPALAPPLLAHGGPAGTDSLTRPRGPGGEVAVSRKTHEKELARARAKRQAERAAQQRSRRMVAGAIVGGVAIAPIVIGLALAGDHTDAPVPGSTG